MVAVSLAAFLISSIRFLCFHFLSWNKSGMETLCQTHDRERGMGWGPAEGSNSQKTPHGYLLFLSWDVGCLRQRPVWPLERNWKRFLQTAVIVTTSTFVSWPLGLTLHRCNYIDVSLSLEIGKCCHTRPGILLSFSWSLAQPTPLKPYFFPFLNLLLRLKRKKPKAFRNLKG